MKIFQKVGTLDTDKEIFLNLARYHNTERYYAVGGHGAPRQSARDSMPKDNTPRRQCAPETIYPKDNYVPENIGPGNSVQGHIVSGAGFLRGTLSWRHIVLGR